MEESWQVLEEVTGSGLAEILRGLLEAQDIPVLLSQEGAGHFVYPTTIGRLGVVQILVPETHFERAQQVLAAYHAGKLAAPEDDLEDAEQTDLTENNDE